VCDRDRRGGDRGPITRRRSSRLNSIAERIIGWSSTEAKGQPLPSVFKLVPPAPNLNDSFQAIDLAALKAADTIRLKDPTLFTPDRTALLERPRWPGGPAAALHRPHRHRGPASWWSFAISTHRATALAPAGSARSPRPLDRPPQSQDLRGQDRRCPRGEPTPRSAPWALLLRHSIASG